MTKYISPVPHTRSAAWMFESGLSQKKKKKKNNTELMYFKWAALNSFIYQMDKSIVDNFATVAKIGEI